MGGPVSREQAAPQRLPVVPWTGPHLPELGRPGKYAGRFDPCTLGELPTIDLSDEGRQLYHAQLYYKPFQSLYQAVFALNTTPIPQRPDR